MQIKITSGFFGTHFWQTAILDSTHLGQYLLHFFPFLTKLRVFAWVLVECLCCIKFKKIVSLIGLSPSKICRISHDDKYFPEFFSDVLYKLGAAFCYCCLQSWEKAWQIRLRWIILIVVLFTAATILGNTKLELPYWLSHYFLQSLQILLW